VEVADERGGAQEGMRTGEHVFTIMLYSVPLK